MGTTYVNLTDSDILNETASYEDIGIDNAEIVKEYNRLIDVAMNNNTVANWQAVSDYKTNNVAVLNKVIISADTINNIIKTILTLEQYAIQKRNQLLIQSDEPTTQAAGDYWIKIDENKNVLDILHYDGSTYESIVECGLATASVGSSNKPIYFKNGQPIECDYEIDYTLSDFGITATAEEINYCEGLNANINNSLIELDTAIKSDYDTLTTSIDNVKHELETDIYNVKSELIKNTNTLNSKIGTNSNNIANNSNRISTNSKNITTNSKNISTNSNKIAANSNKIAIIEKDYLKKTGGTISSNLTVQGNFIVTNGASYADLKPSNSIRCYANLRPDSTDHLRSLGTSDSKWKQLYASTSTISTSDRNVKTDVKEFDERYDVFYDSLKSYLFKFIDGESGRFHSGFISQDVEQSLKEVGLTALDFAGFCRDIKQKEVVVKEAEYDENGNLISDEVTEWVNDLDENGNLQYVYSLRYEEFIALNTNQIQKLKTRVSNLETENAEIKAENAKLKATLENVLERLVALESK